MNGSLGDDIYSIEKLLPAPPKPPKQSKKLVHETVSCPPLQRSISQQNSNFHRHKRQSVHERGKNVACRIKSNPLPSTNANCFNSAEGGNGRLSLTDIDESFCTVTLNPCFSDTEMQGIQSATSISLLHGVVLISIMMTSLATFVSSKLRDPCEDYFLAPNYDCSPIFGVTFSVFYVLSCLYSFTIYFLHLIGKCDYISWSARRKVCSEVACTILMLLLLITSLILFLARTMALGSSILVTSVIFATIVIALYMFRIGLLIREMKMLWFKPNVDPKNGDQIDSSQNSFANRAFKSSLKKSESGSLRSSISSPFNLSQSSRARESFAKKSVSYAKESEASSVELDDIFIRPQ